MSHEDNKNGGHGIADMQGSLTCNHAAALSFLRNIKSLTQTSYNCLQGYGPPCVEFACHAIAWQLKQCHIDIFYNTTFLVALAVANS